MRARGLPPKLISCLATFLGDACEWDQHWTRKKVFETGVWRHVKEVGSLVNRRVKNAVDTDLFHRMQSSSASSPHSKAVLLARLSLLLAPPLPVCLDWISSREHRLVVVAFLCGDFCLSVLMSTLWVRKIRWSEHSLTLLELSCLWILWLLHSFYWFICVCLLSLVAARRSEAGL